jgi:hypothetical protein
MSTAGAVTGGLASILSSLSPGQLLHLGNEISQKSEVRAMSILMTMTANPPGASMAIIGLEAISDLPATVLTFAQAAASAAARGDVAGFQTNMAQAVAALQATKVNPFTVGIFG